MRTYLTPSVFCLILSLNTTLLSQTELTIKHSCNFAEGNATGDVYTYDASKEAVEIIDKIMKVNVLPQNFIVKSADCANALATTQGKNRYILYNTSFLENFKKDAQTAWAAYCVLAHEIGHHLSNHDLEETTPSVRKRFELEADKFAGGVLFKLGASLTEAQAGINTFSNDNASATHPPKRARLEAIAVGWKQAQELSDNANTTDPQADISKEEQALYKRALAEKDPNIAMQMLDSLIEMNGNITDAYFERGKKMKDIEDIRRNYTYAVADFDKYLEVQKRNPEAYFERGNAYLKLGKRKDAIEDFDKAIKFKPQYAEAFLYRGIAKRYENMYEGAISDYKKAIQINPKYAEAYYEFGNFYYGNAEYAQAIQQFDGALKADSLHYHALALRAAARQFSERYNEAISDYNLLQRRHPKDFDNHYNRGQCYQMVGKHKEAIMDFDVIIKKNEEGSDIFSLRGASLFLLGKTTEAEQDFTRFCQRKVSYMYANATDFKVSNPDFGVVQQTIGCLLISLNAKKEGYKWLDLALSSRPDLERAKECRK